MNSLCKLALGLVLPLASLQAFEPPAAPMGQELAGRNSYTVQTQWGGASAPWNLDGVWVIGGRPGQSVVEIHVDGDGETLNGSMNYNGEGPISFRASLESENCWTVENKWGGPDGQWNPGGAWVLGNRSGQPIVAMHATSSDNGRTLTGEITYQGEGPIGFRAFRKGGY